MTAGDFRPVRHRTCRVCGAVGEWAGFLLPCVGCREAGR